MAFKELFVTLQHPKKDLGSHCLFSVLQSWRTTDIVLAT